MTKLRNFTPEGVEDISSIQYEKKDYIRQIIQNVFRSYGYKQILTPTFEYYDLFAGIDTAIDKDQMYKIIDTNGKILVLRPDATIPVARMVATHYDNLDEYLKFMYFTNVFRNSGFHSGGKREFVQAGIEYFGNPFPDADAEVIAIAIQCLNSFGFENIHIDLGQADYFKGLIDELTIADDIKTGMRILIENKNYAELGTLAESIGLENKYREILLQLPFMYGNFKEVTQKAYSMAANDVMKQSVDNMIKIYEMLSYYGFEQFVYADMGLINHLDYYSGITFRAYLGNLGEPAASGGRYDRLLKKFGKEIPATGFGLNLDLIFEAISKSDMLKEETPFDADVLVLFSDKSKAEGIRKSIELRNQGNVVLAWKTDLPPEVCKERYKNKANKIIVCIDEE